MAFVEALSAWAAIPLRLLQHRNRRVERWLGLAISAGDEQAIRIACHRNGVRFGAYYHWYLIKLLLRRQLRRMSRPTMGRMIADTDSSDYGPLDSAMNDPRGLLIAIPHHGHYVLSMASLAAKISLRREVLVFYGDPKTHPGNEIFDDLHVLIYEGAESRVTIIHDNRAGLSKAIRALQNGSAVLIMPDVYKDLDDTFQLPFCGRPYDVMLGTAALARRTHSNILPTVAIPIRPGIRFANQFGPLLHGRQPNSVTAAVTSFEDYKVTAAMSEVSPRFS